LVLLDKKRGGYWGQSHRRAMTKGDEKRRASSLKSSGGGEKYKKQILKKIAKKKRVRGTGTTGTHPENPYGGRGWSRSNKTRRGN